MLTQVNYEVKGQLAKLLATEDLIIENRKVPTAAFDVEKRVLTLPMWEKASGTVYDLLVGHEVGHALYTPADMWQKGEFKDVPMSFVNVFEDVRIERLMKQKFPGLSKTFYTGYSQLAEQDFFEIKDHDIEDLNLADKINLYYKIGNFTKIQFEDNEKIFVERALKTKTFQDVLQLSKDLTVFLQQQMDDPQRTEVPVNGGGQGGELDVPFDATDDVDYGDLEDESEGRGNSEGEEEGQLITDDYESIGGEHNNDLEALTDKSLQDNLENLNEKTKDSYYDPEYIIIPDLNLDTLVVSHTEVHEYIEDWWKQCEDNFRKHSEREFDIFGPVDNEYRLFRRTAQKEVNYLVKEFECKKSADAYARATVAKTGVIDCNKLHSYKYNEDLFRKITTLPDGKNHGLIFVLAWSGSMSHVLQDTVKQLFNLIWFCKKVQIPFQVFAFTNEWNNNVDYHYEYDHEGPPIKRTALPEHHEPEDGYMIVDSQFSMVEFLSSECKKGDLENQMLNLWRLSSSLSGSRRWNPISDYQVYYQSPRRLGLSGTPLNEALVSLNQIIPLFQKKHNVQKIQCITLTDGEAHPLRFSKWIPARYEGGKDYLGQRSAINGCSYIRDKTNGKTYFCKSQYHELTSALLNQLRGRFPNVNFLGIRVMDNRDSSSFIRKYLDWDFDKVHSIQSGWKKNKSLKLTDVGYHAYFGLSSTNLNNDTEFEVKEDASKAQIKSAFKKSLNSKKMNKKVLSEFMEYIA